MTGLDALPGPGFRHPASCLILTGTGRRGIGQLANMVKSVEVATSRGDAWTGSIVFEDRRKEDGTWMVADSGVFSRWERVAILADFTTRVEEVFRGFVKLLKPNFPNAPGEASFEVELQDESSLLDREHMRKVWGERVPQSDGQILQALTLPLGFRVAAGSQDGRQARALNQDATPVRFLRERARANGFEFIFDAGEIYFGPARLSGQPLPPIIIYGGRQTNCTAFTLDDDALRPDQVRYEIAPAEQGTEPDTAVLSTRLPALGERPVAAEGAELSAPAEWRLSREGDETLDETRHRAQALVDEHSLRIKASGELDGSLYGHVLKPARLVGVDGAGSRYGGHYYVDKVGHSFTPDGYRQAFELLRNATGQGAGLPGGFGQAASLLAALW